MENDLKIRMPEWARNMYNRLVVIIDAGDGAVLETTFNINVTGGST